MSVMQRLGLKESWKGGCRLGAVSQGVTITSQVTDLPFELYLSISPPMGDTGEDIPT